MFILAVVHLKLFVTLGAGHLPTPEHLTPLRRMKTLNDALLVTEISLVWFPLTPCMIGRKKARFHK